MTYYAEEQPLPADLGELHIIACATTAAEKDAVKKVADKFFPIDPTDGLRHNARADREIAKARERMVNDPDRKANQAERQRRARARRKVMYEQLREAGVTPPFDATTTELEALITQHVTRDTTPSGHKHVTRDITATRPQTPHAITPETPLRPQDSEGRALDLPDGIDPQAWADWSGHWQAQRKWSAQRQMQAKGHLRAIAAEGGNPSDVLRWALSRGLADLLDCHRRMKLDAAKAAADTKLPGESLADASYRRATEARNNGPAHPAELPLTAALLAIGGPKR